MEIRHDLYFDILYHESFNGKYAIRKFHTKLHPGCNISNIFFHIFYREDIDDVTSNIFPLRSVVFVGVFVFVNYTLA